MAFLLPLLLIAGTWVLLLLQVDPVPTWFYVFAWYPTLVLLDNLSSSLGKRPPILRDPSRTISLFGWSALIWLVFEAANFRLQNWYYVFLPHAAVERWGGILLSFATVLPAIILMERTLAGVGVASAWRSRPARAGPGDVQVAMALGLGMALLALLSPRLFFPLIWGAAWLLTDPIVYRHRPEWSLLSDITRGKWGRIARLMLAGLLVGLLWEFYNYWARGKWIYTVPWLETTKLFEMPPFGFLGFPVFALEAWSMYHALCVLGVAVPFGERDGRGRRGTDRDGRGRTGTDRDGQGRTGTDRGISRSAFAAVLAAVFAVAILLGMERWTISSVVPRLRDLPGITAQQVTELRQAGIDSPFELADSDSAALAALDWPQPLAQRAREAARLTVLRGIGARHASALAAAGIGSICELAKQDPLTLWRTLRNGGPTTRPTPPEMRIWVRAATRRCPDGGTHNSPPD